MLSAVSNNMVQTKMPSFRGDKDILIIHDNDCLIKYMKWRTEEALGDRKDEYNIQTALGGDEGLQKARELKPKLVVTAYNMPGLGVVGGELIRKLKQIGTKVLVNTHNWYGQGDDSRKAGIRACEGYYGADKYVHKMDFEMYDDSVKALIEDKEPPMYPFQTAKGVVNYLA